MPPPTQQAQSYGIPLRSHKEITVPCIRLLRRLLSDHDLGFTGTPVVDGEGEIYLTSNSATQGYADRSYPVIRLLPKEALTYWLALALTFTRDRNLRMTSASIIVFEGVAISSPKTPLLRAEWHEWNSLSPHAQPHWHVYPSALADFVSAVPEAFSVAESRVVDFGTEARTLASPLVAAFHYAMSASWHVANGTCQERLQTNEALLNWIRGCISYTREQLDCVTR
jgi:hypothetical protein